MLKKTITYEDLDGNQVTDDFYFHLNTAELAEMELRYPGGMKGYIETLQRALDQRTIIEIFKEIIGSTVGRKSEDNRQFIKTPALRDEFMQSDAYSVLFLEMYTNPASMAEFIRGCMPASVQSKVEVQREMDRIAAQGILGHQEIRDELAPAKSGLREDLKKQEGSNAPAIIAVRRLSDYTDAELEAMSDAAFFGLVGHDRKKWGARILNMAYDRRMRQ